MSTLRSVTPARFTAIAVTVTAVVVSGIGVAAAADASPTSVRTATTAADPARPDLSGAKVQRRSTDGLGGLPRRGAYAFLLTLDAASTGTVTRNNRGKSRAVLTQATREQRTRIARLQSAVAADLPADSSVLYRTHAVTAGLAVRTDVRNAERLRQLDNVTGVYPITVKKLLNSSAVPLQRAPQAWQTYGDRGQNTDIAVIDTGIDYTHTDFGGPGTQAAYATAQSAAQQTNPTVFPTEKVTDGYDFAGDAYNPGPGDNAVNTPEPDDNPLDCEGHGSHVAGTAAGYGENADGSTYTGAYSTEMPFSSMKIGPGMAPQAKLYAYRIFGCEGGTQILGAALDRAMDPNDDGNTSDRADVANFSLGTDFVPAGGDADAVLVQQASAAGVTIVAASGNAGDVYDVSGSPANEPSAISVAASDDASTAPGTEPNTALNDQLASFSSRGARTANGVKPDVTAVGDTVTSAASGTGDDRVTYSGTSMATPMTAGLAALVRSKNSEWTPEQVKADIMNTAGQDLFTGANHTGTKYGPNRVGAGRIDAKAALDNSVLAYTTGPGVPTGTVSASFGPVAATAATTTLQKTITVQNVGESTATYSTAYVARTTVPGATYSVSPSTVTVAAGASATVTVTLTLTRAQLTKTIDPTVSRNTDFGDGDVLARQYVADASGLVTLTPTAGATVPLRVPVYAAPRPASTITQPSGLLLPAGSMPSAKLSVTGSGVNQGSGSTLVRSAVAGFELQATSGLAAACTAAVTTNCVHNAVERGADLKYVGATTSAPQDRADDIDPFEEGYTYFSITTQGPWRTPSGYQDFYVYIDSTGDNVPDAVTYTSRLVQGVRQDPTDVMVAVTESLTSNDVLDIEPLNDTLGDNDTAVFDSDTLVLPVAIGALPGITDTKTRIRYSVAGVVGGAHVVDSVSGLSMNVLRPGVTAVGTTRIDEFSALLYVDQPGSLTVKRDNATYALDNGLGALIVHFQNPVGQKAKPVTLSRQPTRATLTLTPTTVRAGTRISGVITIGQTSGQVATGTVTLRRYAAGKPVQTIAAATLSGGRATKSFVQAAKGTFAYRVLFAGDKFNAAALSPPVIVRSS